MRLKQFPNSLNFFTHHGPLIVTDKGVTGAGLINHVTAALAGSDVTIGAIVDGCSC